METLTAFLSPAASALSSAAWWSSGRARNRWQRPVRHTPARPCLRGWPPCRSRRPWHRFPVRFPAPLPGRCLPRTAPPGSPLPARPARPCGLRNCSGDGRRPCPGVSPRHRYSRPPPARRPARAPAPGTSRGRGAECRTRHSSPPPVSAALRRGRAVPHGRTVCFQNQAWISLVGLKLVTLKRGYRLACHRQRRQPSAFAARSRIIGGDPLQYAIGATVSRARHLSFIASKHFLCFNRTMTLTELKYIVAVARAKHFGHAAEACFVAQPTLSVAIKKLEDELGVVLFERGGAEISVTPLGAQIIAQAERVLEQTAAIKELAKQNKDPLAGPLRLGVIYTIGPYLLPPLVKGMIAKVPQMPLILQENFTVKLLEMLRQGELDAAIMALPLPEHGMAMQVLYDEPFVVAMPSSHPWTKRKTIPADDLKTENMLLLGNGHCFRDQVLEVCPEMARFSSPGNGIARTFEGSSLETIRHMVASGIGITVLPQASVSDMHAKDGMVRYVPFAKPVPSRRVVLAWRKSFTRSAAIDAVKHAVMSCNLHGVTMLYDAQLTEG